MNAILVCGPRHGEVVDVPDFRERHAPEGYFGMELWVTPALGAALMPLPDEWLGEGAPWPYEVAVCWARDVPRDTATQHHWFVLALAKASGALCERTRVPS